MPGAENAANEMIPRYTVAIHDAERHRAMGRAEREGVGVCLSEI